MNMNDIQIDEPRVRTYIQGFLDEGVYGPNEQAKALTEANRGAFSQRIWNRGLPEFMKIFYEEWDKKYPTQ